MQKWGNLSKNGSQMWPWTKKGVKTTFGLRMREFSHLAKRRARACSVEEKKRLVGFCAPQGFYSS